MFTGIIEEKGKIRRISKGKIETIFVESGLENKKGDSIAIQGICLTVTGVDKQGFSVEAVRQTRRITTLSDWQIGNHVNLERALRIGDRLGGHIMLGHVDEVGKLVRIRGNEYFFQRSVKNTKYIIPKGSVGIDGVSLTVSNVSKNVFSVNLVPFTLKNTTLGILKTGSFVNIELDYLLKYLKT